MGLSQMSSIPLLQQRTATVASLLLLALSGSAAAAAAAGPSVYWVTNPTLANETLLVAGSFSDSVSAQLCTAKDCSGGSVVPTPTPAHTWAHSVKTVLPAACGPPCYLSLTDSSSTADDNDTSTGASGASASASAVVVTVNAPDLWWALSGSPSRGAAVSLDDRQALSNEPLQVTVTLGDTLRVFGRGLGWSEDNKVCLSAADDPTAVATTRLALGAAAMVADDHHQQQEGQPQPQPQQPLGSLWANCYEAAFATSSLSAGHYPGTTVHTAWGSSPQPLDLTIIAPPSGAASIHQLTVGAGAEALTSSLKSAAAYVSSHPTALVEIMLGPHAYKLTSEIKLPDRTRYIDITVQYNIILRRHRS